MNTWVHFGTNHLSYYTCCIIYQDKMEKVAKILSYTYVMNLGLYSRHTSIVEKGKFNLKFWIENTELRGQILTCISGGYEFFMQTSFYSSCLESLQGIEGRLFSEIIA